MSRATFRRGKSFLEYEIIKLIGQGGFTDVYFVLDKKKNKRRVLKTEKRSDSQTLLREQTIMQDLPKCSLFPKYYGGGKSTNYNFCLMEPLGPSLSTMRRVLPGQKFSLQTTLHMALEMLRCIEKLHKAGFIHRDIKPGNFLIRGSRTNPLVLVDFGLARRYRNPDSKTIFKARVNRKFVGTPKYASVNAHLSKDLGRRDDLISWWYSIIEMRKGELPWSHYRDKGTILREKSYPQIDKVLALGLPKQIHAIWRCIRQYSFKEKPNYALLRSFIVEAMTERRITFDDKFDWEQLPALTKEHISIIDLDIPKGEEPTVPDDLVAPVVPGEEPWYERCCDEDVGCCACYSEYDED